MINTILIEYKTLLEKIYDIQLSLDSLPRGYISKKTIKGKEYYYLQNRENGKITSKYIKKENVNKICEQLEQVKQYNKELPTLKTRLLEIEHGIKLIDKNTSREIIVLKLSYNMDFLNKEQKDNSIMFANAMNSIEGIYVSEVTQGKVDDWKYGRKTFNQIFNETLNMYGFTTEVNNA